MQCFVIHTTVQNSSCHTIQDSLAILELSLMAAIEACCRWGWTLLSINMIRDDDGMLYWYTVLDTWPPATQATSALPPQG